ncbi:MAG TPA: GNAT family N-acetyltransferase [Victivallales bacterium]|nr:GNAT family N-acetyltransferase [Victivallales bacterium]
MNNIKLRSQDVSDAERFYEILNNPNFIYFSACPESIEDERKFLEKNEKNRADNREYNYSILFNDNVVGAIGLRVDQNRSYIAEAGYFIKEKYWNRGFATEALLLLEKIAFEELDIKRIEIMMITKNTASEKIAIKCGYLKEGTSRKKIKVGEDYFDCHLYAKINF